MTIKRLLLLLSHLSSLDENADVEIAITCGPDDEFPILFADAEEVSIHEDGTLMIRGPKGN